MANKKNGNKMITERLLWFAFALLFFLVTTGGGYLVTALGHAQRSVYQLESQNETNKVQWSKISMMREDYWKSQVSQAYRNGCMETSIEFIQRGFR